MVDIEAVCSNLAEDGMGGFPSLHGDMLELYLLYLVCERPRTCHLLAAESGA